MGGDCTLTPELCLAHAELLCEADPHLCKVRHSPCSAGVFRGGGGGFELLCLALPFPQGTLAALPPTELWKSPTWFRF